jgi:hypothetical protein
MFGDGQTLRKCLLAGVTEELVVGHEGPHKVLVRLVEEF